MDKLTLKKAIVHACVKNKRETEQHLLATVKELEQSANEYGQPRDGYDSYRAQVSARREMLAQQLIKVQDEIDLLDRIDLSREYSVAGFGAVVITSVQKVFISIGIGKIKLDDGIEFYAISAVVPFAKAVHDRKKGESFEFNGRKFEILDLF